MNAAPITEDVRTRLVSALRYLVLQREATGTVNLNALTNTLYLVATVPEVEAPRLPIVRITATLGCLDASDESRAYALEALAEFAVVAPEFATADETTCVGVERDITTMLDVHYNIAVCNAVIAACDAIAKCAPIAFVRRILRVGGEAWQKRLALEASARDEVARIAADRESGPAYG